MDDDDIVPWEERHGTPVDLGHRSPRTSLAAVRACAAFRRLRGPGAALPVGDYLISGEVVVERKTHADFSTSLLDGRLFPQAAALAHGPHRPLILLEGPPPERLPDVHPHALEGAMASLAVMWRLPVLQARDPEDSLRLFPALASRLLARFGSIERVMAADAKALMETDGVGPAKAARIRELVA